MKLFIEEYHNDVELCLYGVDNEEHTFEYLVIHFGDKNILRELTDEEKEKYDTEAELAIHLDDYNKIAGIALNWQTAIDKIAADQKRSNCNIEEEYCIDGYCYII